MLKFDLSAIKSQFFIAASEPNPAQGLSDLEAEQIAWVFGKSQKSRIFTLSEYNPAIEKFQSGAILNNIFQSFFFGVG